MAYTDKTKIEEKLGQTLPSTISTADLDVYIEEIQAYIDAYTNTTFEASGETSRLYSTRPSSNLVVIDQAVSVSKVEYLVSRTEEGDTWTEYKTTAYRLKPENATPKTLIDFSSNSLRIPMWLEGGNANIRVTGVFGYSSTVPATIQMVATDLVVEMLRDRGDIDSIVSTEKLGDASFSYTNQSFAQKRERANKLLDRYRDVGDLRI